MKLILDTEIISKLDFIFAKARYSKLINGITPKINENKFHDGSTDTDFIL